MAESNQFPIEFTLVSEWDLSGRQYAGVIASTAVDKAVRVSSLVGTAIIGVVQNKPTSGRAARVRTHGITKALAGVAITRGTRVDVDAGGYMRPTVSSNYAGYALETVVVSATFEMVLNPQYTGA